jgi:hypothetical protein
MTVLVATSVLGTFILLLAIRLIAQSGSKRPRPVVTADEYTDARQALDSVFVEATVIKRIFSVEDMEFIARSATPAIKSTFVNERKKLAIKWLRKTRNQMARLMDLHLRLASYTYDPSPGYEIRLTAKYLTFVTVSEIVLLLVWVLGPFKATRSIFYAIRTAGSFCSTFSMRLEQVNPTRLGADRQSLVH